MRRGPMLWIAYRLLAIPVLIVLLLKALVSPFLPALRILPALPKKKRHGYDRVLSEYGERLSKINFDRADWEVANAELPISAVQLYAAWEAYEEISTERFGIYFLSSTGSSAPEARDGFERMGIPEVAKVIQSAMDKVERPFPRDLARRCQIIIDDDTDFSPEQMSFERLLGIKNIMWGPSQILREKADAFADANILT